MPLFDFAPTTDVFLSQLYEIDGTFEFGPPSSMFDLALISIDLHKRAGTDERIHRVIVQTYIAVHRLPQI